MEYCNGKFFEVVGIPPRDPREVEWKDLFIPDDMPFLEKVWAEHVTQGENATAQVRLNRLWTSPDGALSNAWVLFNSYCERGKDGTVTAILGALVDISYFKWAEISERLRKEEALEQKRQQENFIDSTSHEMRNPLTAVLQCADASAALLRDMSTLIEAEMRTMPSTPYNLLKQQLHECADAVRTIEACALHQHRIVNDLLVLSKLDSRLLLISPSKVSPVDVIQDAMKLVELDAAKADVQLRLNVEESVNTLDASFVMIDPSRVTQILM